MDDLDYQGSDLKTTLGELDFINRWLGGEKISLCAMKKLDRHKKINSVADLGCGSGKILQKIREKYPLIACTGIDANPHIIDHAKAIHPEINFKCQNILDPSFSTDTYDVIHCCLFLHHFTDEELIALFSIFKQQANVGIIVNDLHRHPLAYWSIALLTGLFSKSKLVKNDARLSVSRGFKRSELAIILKEADIKSYDLSWRWAFRWELIIYA